MRLRPDDLANHLKRTLAPLYVIHGDEPLLALEAGDFLVIERRSAAVDCDVVALQPPVWLAAV